MKSIFFRQFVTTSLLILLSFLILGMTFIWMIFQYVSSEREQQMDNIAYYLADYSENYVYQDNLLFNSQTYALYEAGLSVMSGVTGVQTMAIDQEGYIIACSEGFQCEHINKKVPEDIIQSVLDGTPYRGVREIQEITDPPISIVVQPISSANGTVVGALMAYRQTSDIYHLIFLFSRYFITAALLVLAISALIGSYITKKVTNPMTQIAKTAREFAQGEYKNRIPVDAASQDEISQVALAFNEMAESMEKSEEIRRNFIANVSHELRTPMTTIAGYVDGILDGTIPPERQSHYLGIIKDEVRRMNKLVHTMLELARMQSGGMTLEKTSFDLCEQCSRTALNIEERISARKLEMSFDFPQEKVMVQADRDKITQVITNLLDNAMKFAPENTAITMKVALKGEKAYTTISNYGPEIPKEDLAHVFDRFHKADRSRGKDREGLGLGLYIVKAILSQHGEKIWVESENGQTSFTFTLKLNDSKLKPLQNPSLKFHSDGRDNEEKERIK